MDLAIGKEVRMRVIERPPMILEDPVHAAGEMAGRDALSACRLADEAELISHARKEVTCVRCLYALERRDVTNG